MNAIVQRKEKRRRYRSSDLDLHPSRMEGVAAGRDARPMVIASLRGIPWRGGGGDHVIVILGVASLDSLVPIHIGECAGLHGCHVIDVT